MKHLQWRDIVSAAAWLLAGVLVSSLVAAIDHRARRAEPCISMTCDRGPT